MEVSRGVECDRHWTTKGRRRNSSGVTARGREASLPEDEYPSHAPGALRGRILQYPVVAVTNPQESRGIETNRRRCSQRTVVHASRVWRGRGETPMLAIHRESLLRLMPSAAGKL